ncbi:uncharacterized protein LOC130647182 isoform X2 [Hydractinia symbiolongicarpus]|uniref:uncharacterized protein LOC130647182 isoform X2 n=1 Tax=Hydractinia symbiolongicarpus TaxID=13093 RepID=UPI00254F669F|nr:uncharacterized protein LOC130647182 isoform X2 [Hydractinia symbiolongicarpus]
MGSAKVQMSLWIMWKKKILPKSEEANDEYIEVKKAFNSKMTEIFQGSDVDDVLDRMIADIKPHVEHLALPQSGSTISPILHLDVDFHKLQLTRGSSYIELPKWIASKKAIINPVNEDEECFKWGVIASLHNAEMGRNPNQISHMQRYVDLYNWQDIEFPTTIKDISKFEKNNTDIALNVLYVMGKKINILRRSEHNIGRNKQVNLLLITDEGDLEE